MYPNLTTLVHRMDKASAIELPMLPEDKWQWPDNAETLEVIAAGLTEEEVHKLVQGEPADEPLPDNPLHQLSLFLDSVYDGNLTPSFYEWDEEDWRL